MIKSNKEFDKSICYTHFESYSEKAKKIAKKYGREVGYDFLIALSDYALYGTEPTEDMNIFLDDVLMNIIDKSQTNRSHGFLLNEDLETSVHVLQGHLDNPDLSIRKLAALCNCSKTKVENVLKKQRENRYNGIIEMDTSGHFYIINDIYNNNNSNNNNDNCTYNYNYNCIGQGQDRDKDTNKKQRTKHKASTMLTIEEQNKVLDIWIGQNKNKHKLNAYEIANTLGFDKDATQNCINIYMNNGKQRPVDNSKLILLQDGTYSNMTTDDWKEIDKEDILELYYKFIDPNGEYKYSKEYVDKWFNKDFNIEIIDKEIK